MSFILLVGFYTLILNNTNSLRSKKELATVPVDNSNSSDKIATATTANNNSGLKVYQPGQAQSQPPSQPQSQPQPQPQPTNLSAKQHINRKYNEGSYSVGADYLSPSGIDEFDVTIEIREDRIVSVETSLIPSSNHSRYFQEALFGPGISGVVEGKDLDDATLIFAVNGASLQSIAFNGALERIKQEAKRSIHNVAFSNN